MCKILFESIKRPKIDMQYQVIKQQHKQFSYSR